MLFVKRWVTKAGVFYTAEYRTEDFVARTPSDKLFKCPIQASASVLSALSEWMAPSEPEIYELA